VQTDQKFEDAPGNEGEIGLRRYASESIAIEIENSEDPIHFLYPHKLIEVAGEFLTKFSGFSLYAVKANPNPVLLRLLWSAGLTKFEVASLREVEMITALLPEAELYFMHPVKSRRAIQVAYQKGVRHFSYDSLEELRKIREETCDALDLCLHLRVAVSQYGAAYPLDAKFGATMVEAPLLLAYAREFASKLGVTFHVGSQCLDVNAYGNAIAEVASMRDGCGIRLDMLNVGGGFPVAYPDMMPQPLASYFDAINVALHAHGFAEADLYCEPGRALVAEGGAVAARVELRRGQALYLNDGTYGSLFDAGQPGWCFPVTLHAADGRAEGSEMELFQFFGPTCDSIDKMAGPFTLPGDVREGDWIIFQNLGAYGYALQTRFNGFYSETTVAIDKVLDLGGRP